MQEFFFREAENETYAVIGYKGDEPDVIIPPFYWGKPVTVLFDRLFSGHAEIRTVTIPDSVAEMGEFLFDGCYALKTLRLPAQLTNLWGATFARCGLVSLTLPDKVRSLPPFAFKDCRDLKKLVCNPKLESIRAWAFMGCDALEQVVYDGTTKVSPQAFENKNA